MRTHAAVLVTATTAFAIGLFVAGTTRSLQGQAQPAAGFAAVPGEKGGWDITGPYDVVRDWPKPLSQLPGHENWTWGAGEAIFAESADRVFFIQMGELPKLQRPPVAAIPQIGPSLSFPVGEGDYPGAFLNMHGATVDPEGNLYIAEVGNGRLQKFTPRRGARPELLIGKPPVPRS